MFHFLTAAVLKIQVFWDVKDIKAT